MQHGYRRLGSSWITPPLCFLALASLFFLEPLLTHTAPSGADLIYSFTNYTYLAPEGYRPSNRMLEDQVTQFEPWRAFARAEIRAGRLPWHNPYQAQGVPLIGNLQSAVFYPTQWLYYLLPVNIAVTLAAILKILTAGLGQYVLLRSLRLCRGVCYVGGVAFAFGGFNIVWLNHPHSNVSVLLPWFLLFTMMIFAHRAATHRLGALGLIAAILLQVLGGHIQTALHICFASGTLFVFLLTMRLIRPGAIGLTVRMRRMAASLLRYIVPISVGLILASIQIIPFVMYLRDSDALATRIEQRYSTTTQPARIVLSWLAPNVFGNPRDGNYCSAFLTLQVKGPLEALSKWVTKSTHFNEAIGGYVGSLLLVLAPLAFVARRHRSIVIWASTLFATCTLVVLGVRPVFDAVTWLPGFRFAQNQRLQLLTAQMVILLGCIGLNELMRREDLARSLFSRRNRTVLLTTTLFVVVCCGTGWLISPWHSSILDQFIGQLALLGLILVGAILLLSARSSGRLGKRTCLASLMIVLMAELLWCGYGYNPSFDLTERFPLTPGLGFLQAHEPEGTVLFIGNTLPPDIATAYRIRDLRSYDAMGKAAHVKHMRDAFQIGDNQRQTIGFLPRIQHVLDMNGLYGFEIRYIAIGAADPLAPPARAQYRSQIVYDGGDLLIVQVKAAAESPR